MSAIVSRNEGEVEVRFTKTYAAKSLREVLELTVREGACTQIGLAAAVRKGLQDRGYRIADGGRFSDSHFRGLVNSSDSDLYLWVEVLDIIMETQNVHWVLEFLAAKHGLALIKAAPQSRSTDKGEDE